MGISPDGRGLLVRLVAADGPLAGGKKPFAQNEISAMCGNISAVVFVFWHFSSGMVRICRAKFSVGRKKKWQN